MGFFYESGMQPEKKEKKNTTTVGATGKKHTIKSRTKATTAFALRQVRDAIVAGGVLLIAKDLATNSLPTISAGIALGTAAPAIPAIGLAAIGVASFLGSKMVFKGVNKHIIKKREKGKISKKSVVASAIAIAAPITTLLVGGFAPAAVVSIGVGTITLAKKLHNRKKIKKNEEDEHENTESKTR